MPSLAETLRKNSQKNLVRGPGGALSEETTEEIQQLAGQAGLPAPPTTAIGAAALGATPKQQDMMGTPAQKQAALNLSSQAPGATIQDAMRRQQVRSQATEQEAAQQEKSENLKQLGGLGDRVNDFINAQRAKLEQSQVALQAADQQVKTVQGGAVDMVSLKPLLQQLSADPNNMELQLQVNQALGYDVNRQLSPEEIGSLYKNATESIIAAGGQDVDNNLNVDDLVQLESFGYTKDQLAGLLNVPVEQLGAMSVGQIRSQVNQLLADEFSKTAEMERQAGSLTAGAAERALARQGAREASRVGVRSTEADIQNLEQQIANADQVQFGGQTYQVDQLLQDDTISGIISDYINSAPGSPIRTQLEQSEPQLIQFIQKNQALLADAAEKLSGGAQQFQQLQQENLNTATLGGALDPAVARDLVPGINELSAKKLDPSTVPVLAAAQNMGQGQRAQYGASIQQIGMLDPNATKELGSMSAEEIAALGLDRSNGRWVQFRDQKERYDDIMQTPDQDILGLVSKVFDQGDRVDFLGDVRQNAINKAMGFRGASGDGIDIIDADGDGRIDSAADIRSRIIQGQPSLRDALTGQKKVADNQAYGDPAMVPDYDKKIASEQIRFGKGSLHNDQLQASLHKRLKNVAANGHLAASELADAYGDKVSGVDADIQAAEMNHLLRHAPLDDEARNTLQGLLQQRVQQVTDKMIAEADKLANLDKLDKFVESGDWYDIWKNGPKQLASLDKAIAEVSETMKSGYANYNTDTLQQRLKDMQKYRKTLDQFINYAPEQLDKERRAEADKAQKKREEEFNKNPTRAAPKSKSKKK